MRGMQQDVKVQRFHEMRLRIILVLCPLKLYACMRHDAGDGQLGVDWPTGLRVPAQVEGRNRYEKSCFSHASRWMKRFGSWSNPNEASECGRELSRSMRELAFSLSRPILAYLA